MSRKSSGQRPISFRPLPKLDPKINIMDEEAAQKADAILCVRVEDATPVMRFVCTVRAKCAVCGKPVLLSSKSPNRPPKICQRCYSEQMADAFAANPDMAPIQACFTKEMLQEAQDAIELWNLHQAPGAGTTVH